MGPHIKVFGWKMIHGILPCVTALHSKGVSFDLQCRVCGSFKKSMLHIFLGLMSEWSPYYGPCIILVPDLQNVSF